jgi:hypothetical protein
MCDSTLNCCGCLYISIELLSRCGMLVCQFFVFRYLQIRTLSRNQMNPFKSLPATNLKHFAQVRRDNSIVDFDVVYAAVESRDLV